jgi:hypothetical protein
LELVPKLMPPSMILYALCLFCLGFPAHSMRHCCCMNLVLWLSEEPCFLCVIWNLEQC